jgi:hypothetical protein
MRGFSQWVQLCTWSPNKLWRSSSIFNVWVSFINLITFPSIRTNPHWFKYGSWTEFIISPQFGYVRLRMGSWTGFSILPQGRSGYGPRLRFDAESWTSMFSNLTSGVNQDPDLHGSALIWLSWIQIQIQEQEKFTKITKKTDFHPFKKAFVPAGVSFMIFYQHSVYFSCKSSIICDCKVWTGSGSGWTHVGLAPLDSDRIEVKSWILIRLLRLTLPWPDLVRISGAMYSIVPQNVCVTCSKKLNLVTGFDGE